MNIYRTTHQERIERASREAAEWLRDMKDSPDSDDRHAFMDWVRASPLHLRELLVLRALEDELHAPETMNRVDLDAVIATAKSENNVLPLHDASRIRQLPARRSTLPRPRSRSRMWTLARVAVLVSVLGIASIGGWLTVASFTQGHSYATTVGEQRQLTLADGTGVTMAPRSRISVDFSAGERDVTLYAGEAWFDVVHNASRPFRVYAGASVVQDVGTYFGVNRLPSGTVVTVSEGEVKVTARHPSLLDDGIGAWLESWLPADLAVIRQPRVAITPLKGQRTISAGHTAHITRNGRELTLTESRPDNARSAARAKQLTFHNSTLADIAAEFNRYNTRQIVVEGEAARAQRYSGVIDADDAASFLQFLTCCSRLELTEDGNRTVIRFPTRGVAIWH